MLSRTIKPSSSEDANETVDDVLPDDGGEVCFSIVAIVIDAVCFQATLSISLSLDDYHSPW